MKRLSFLAFTFISISTCLLADSPEMGAGHEGSGQTEKRSY